MRRELSPLSRGCWCVVEKYFARVSIIVFIISQNVRIPLLPALSIYFHQILGQRAGEKAHDRNITQTNLYHFYRSVPCIVYNRNDRYNNICTTYIHTLCVVLLLDLKSCSPLFCNSINFNTSICIYKQGLEFFIFSSVFFMFISTKAMFQRKMSSANCWYCCIYTTHLHKQNTLYIEKAAQCLPFFHFSYHVCLLLLFLLSIFLCAGRL